MSKISKKIISFAVSLCVFMGISVECFAGELPYINTNVTETYTIKMLDGSLLTEEEFIEYLDKHADEIVKVNDKSKNSSGRVKRQAGALIAGTWWIPGVGEVVITATGIVIVGGATIAAGSWLYNKIVQWFNDRDSFDDFSDFEYHYDKHAGEFKDSPGRNGKKPNKKEYHRMAKDLRDREDGSILKGTSSSYPDRTVKFDPDTWGLVIYDTATKFIRTFYIPNHVIMERFKDRSSFIKSMYNHFEGITQ